jgi:hypothetical protein
MSQSGACSACGTTAAEVQWSVRMGAVVCASCYAPAAPRLPDDWVPYEAPPPPRPHARDLALDRIHGVMTNVAPAVFTDEGVTGTCPVCRAVLRARVGPKWTTLECDHGCDEAAIWGELGL